MQKFRNVLISLFLVLMLAFSLYSMRLYSNLEKEKIKGLKLKDSLQVQLTSNLALQERYDTLLRHLSDSIPKDINSVKNVPYGKVFQDIKILQQESAKLNNPTQYTQALQLEKEGFTALVNNQFIIAMVKFTAAEKLSPSIHMSYEISRLLRKNKNKFDSPETQKEIKQEIIKRYSWGASRDLIATLKKQVNEDDVIKITGLPDNKN